ncbi:hypothetical protein [Mycobacterium branderi]|uniref:Uncharacterized protein n=1 Tax=Mycobacterium branderi TaxID=43348 RepID=A0AA91LSS3_9MYCO|nr:hypothetical protein [Mycobacterium branderi]MCV7234108.1 hypothetical protein [Mycobacterium branderi]ORA32232.1 hypothetical protein BST20_25435 [Mycobacterium branderi]
MAKTEPDGYAVFTSAPSNVTGALSTVHPGSASTAPAVAVTCANNAMSGRRREIVAGRPSAQADKNLGAD